jgi:SAM-dependent methyltransferase
MPSRVKTAGSHLPGGDGKMQAYNQVFARVYNSKWSGFARHIAPFIHDFYASTSIGQENKCILDLCCGSGQLALHFLEKGYQVLGLDLSEHMLTHARENARQYVETGQANFMQGDASDFALNQRFGLVISTFDALNHLENEQALKSCFACVHAVSDGFFIFDLNTRKGLKRWNSIQINEDEEDALIITRGIYDGQSDKAWARITGFMQVPNGLYEHFEETVFNSVFEMDKVKQALLDIGWRDVHFAQVQDLKTPIMEPEKEGRIFIVASK